MPSSKLLFFIILGFIAACSSGEHQNSDLAQALPEEPAENFRSRCDQKYIALDCAKYAYRIRQSDPSQSLIYAQKACGLNDQTSCFNVEQIKYRSIEHNSNIIRSQQDQVLSCYVNHSEDKKSTAGFSLKKEEQHKVLDMQFSISPAGKLEQVSVQGLKLSDKFKQCVSDVFKSRKFIGSEHGQRINYGLILPFVEQKKNIHHRDAII